MPPDDLMTIRQVTQRAEADGWRVLLDVADPVIGWRLDMKLYDPNRSITVIAEFKHAGSDLNQQLSQLWRLSLSIEHSSAESSFFIPVLFGKQAIQELQSISLVFPYVVIEDRLDNSQVRFSRRLNEIRSAGSHRRSINLPKDLVDLDLAGFLIRYPAAVAVLKGEAVGMPAMDEELEDLIKYHAKRLDELGFYDEELKDYIGKYEYLDKKITKVLILQRNNRNIVNLSLDSPNSYSSVVELINIAKNSGLIVHGLPNIEAWRRLITLSNRLPPSDIHIVTFSWLDAQNGVRG